MLELTKGKIYINGLKEVADNYLLADNYMLFMEQEEKEIPTTLNELARELHKFIDSSNPFKSSRYSRLEEEFYLNSPLVGMDFKLRIKSFEISGKYFCLLNDGTPVLAKENGEAYFKYEFFSDEVEKLSYRDNNYAVEDAAHLIISRLEK